MQENINLKNQLNKMNTEKMNAKREITNLENELLQKEKIKKIIIKKEKVKMIKIKKKLKKIMQIQKKIQM